MLLSKRLSESLEDVAEMNARDILRRWREEDELYAVERALEEKHDLLFPRRGRGQTIAEDGDYYYGGGWDW